MKWHCSKCKHTATCVWLGSDYEGPLLVCGVHARAYPKWSLVKLVPMDPPPVAEKEE